MNMIEKQVLNLFISKNQGCDYMLDAYHVEEFGKQIGLSYRNASAVIKHLANEGYLEVMIFDNGNICFARLTYKGLYYKKHSFKNIFKYLVVTILIPALIALFSTVIQIILEK